MQFPLFTEAKCETPVKGAQKLPDGWADAVKLGTCLKTGSDAMVKSVKIACSISTADNKATMSVSNFMDEACASACKKNPVATLKEGECDANPVVPTTWIKFGKLEPASSGMMMYIFIAIAVVVIFVLAYMYKTKWSKKD